LAGAGLLAVEGVAFGEVVVGFIAVCGRGSGLCARPAACAASRLLLLAIETTFTPTAMISSAATAPMTVHTRPLVAFRRQSTQPE
jgi:hypothetical protein